MQHSSTGVEVSTPGVSHIVTQDTAKEESKPTVQTSASAAAVTEDIQAQLEKDKRLIYG